MLFRSPISYGVARLLAPQAQNLVVQSLLLSGTRIVRIVAFMQCRCITEKFSSTVFLAYTYLENSSPKTKFGLNATLSLTKTVRIKLNATFTTHRANSKTATENNPRYLDVTVGLGLNRSVSLEVASRAFSAHRYTIL